MRPMGMAGRGICRCRSDAIQGAGSSQKRPLPQGGLPDRPGGRRLHLPGRAGHPHPTHHGYPDQPVGPDLPGPEFSIRPEGLWRMPPAVPVRGGWRGQRPHGDSILKTRSCNKPGPSRKVRTSPNTVAGGRWSSIAWRGWSNWPSPPISPLAGPRPSFSYFWPPRWPT